MNEANTIARAGNTDTASDQKKYITGDWTHIFERANRDVSCRILIDAEDEKLLRVQIQSGRTWRAASRDEFSDLLDSLTNANPEVFSDPAGCGLAMTDEKPVWAND